MILKSVFRTTGCHLITRANPQIQHQICLRNKEEFKIMPSLKWSIIKPVPSYSNISKKFHLYLQKKFGIPNYPNPNELLNKTSESLFQSTTTLTSFYFRIINLMVRAYGKSHQMDILIFQLLSKQQWISCWVTVNWLLSKLIISVAMFKYLQEMFVTSLFTWWS